ncbi:MAG: hypothetical protein HYS04_22405 [Acidobacteria bacterium]|nr:hypothetical protein [Acidobacteriota bacterium]
MRRLHALAAAAAAAAATPSLFAQAAISARAGMIHYTEGKVLVAGQEVTTRAGDFPVMKEGQELRTSEGRTEVLLTPGVFLRLAESSGIKLVANRLADTRVEVLAGSVLVECAELAKEHSVTLLYKDMQLGFRKPGLFRIDAGADQLRVYDGEVTVSRQGETVTVKEGRQTPLAGVLVPEKFDKKVGDSFYRWASRRAEYIAAANLSAARSLADQEVSLTRSIWRFNPFLGLYTYIPVRGIYTSPFGCRYYSAGGAIVRYYEGPPPMAASASRFPDPMPRYNPNLGYSTAPRSSGVYQGSASPSGANAGAAAAVADNPRTSESATGRGGGSEGRGR